MQAVSIGSWNNTFTNQIQNQSQSFKFMKRLIAIAISNITYMRAVFPEDDYSDREIEGLKVKLIKSDSTQQANNVTRCLKGIFDAIEKKYLETLIFGFYLDEANPDVFVETYKFKFEYNNNERMEIVNVKGESFGSFASDLSVTKKETIGLLRSLLILGQTLKPLPDTAKINIKLYYYDDVTPLEYEPPGFMKAESDAAEVELHGSPRKIKFGHSSTSFHKMSLKILTSSKCFADNDTTTNLCSQVETSQNIIMQDENRSNDLEPLNTSKSPCKMSVNESGKASRTLRNRICNDKKKEDVENEPVLKKRCSEYKPKRK